ncbi:Uracil-DNA glycosylase-like protein, partial [Amanita muscaria]
PSAKKKKLKRGYAEPEQYAHLNELPDILAPELDVLFCGINPGQYSATVGHHFASPRNQFWRCLHDAELTGNKLVPASDDHTLPKRFSLGLTNLVHRPTAEQNELSDKELRAGVPAFLSKVAEYRPHVVCFVGLGIAKTVKTCCLPKGAEGRGTARVGFQPFKLVYVKDPETSVHETLFYALPSTSGRVVQFQREDKAMLLRELKTKLIDIKTGQFDTNYMHTV